VSSYNNVSKGWHLPGIKSGTEPLTSKKEKVMKILKVDMTQGKIESMPVPEGKAIGGRGMINYLMTEYGSATAHPLSPEALFVAAIGILGGSAAPNANRLSVGGKSPLTGGIKEANAGGVAGQKLGRLGIQALMVDGKSDEWKVLKLNAEGASLEPAGDILGLKNYAACDKLRERYGEKVGIMIIGPAGEMKMCNSSVAVTDPEGRPARHCGRGGVGAIMGAKGLKAVVIDDSGGALRKPVNEEAFKAAVKESAEAIRAGDFTEAFHTFGTPMFVEADNERGSLPTYNHRQGSFEDEKRQKMNANAIHETNKARVGNTGCGHTCMPGCVIQCSPEFYDKEGNHVTSGFEYETLAMLGPNLGVDDLDAIARMDRACDENGLDTVETGCTIGLLNDAGLFEFGDAARAEALIEEVAQGTHLGRIIGSGTANAATVLGIDRVPAVKGQGIPAHAARTSKGWAIAYTSSPQGADHTAGVVLDEPLSKEGQVERGRQSQILTAAFDSTGLCMFTFLTEASGLLTSLINSLTGTNLSEDDYVQMGKDTLKGERAFNLKAGIGPEADRLPDWMRTEPLPPTNEVFDVPQEEIDDFWNF
jgi:aldehyde:ferredoxin oxidoreductase